MYAQQTLHEDKYEDGGKTRPTPRNKIRKTWGDTLKSKKLGREHGVWKRREEEKGRSGPALFVHSSEVCAPQGVCWPSVLSAVSLQCLTFTMIYDSSLPEITPRKLFASLPVWPNSAVWDTWISQRGAEDAAIQYPPRQWYIKKRTPRVKLFCFRK